MSEGIEVLARVARDTELMRSFLRTGETLEAPSKPQEQPKQSSKKQQKQAEPQQKPWVLSKELKAKRRPRRRKHEETYTDKDRAAAVNLGSRDIKQSLKIKKKEDRIKTLHLSEEIKPEALLSLAGYEMRARRYDLAFIFIGKALDLNPEDKKALVERSKCYLLLGEPQLALKDAETALSIDSGYINALYQKAESLYHLGNFEEALMYFHRGLRVRPDLTEFRLGVSKSTEAIENIIGSGKTSFLGPPEVLAKLLEGLSTLDDVVQAAASLQQKSDRHLQGGLRRDKNYLENVLKDKSDIINLKENFALNEVELYAREGLKYLSGRGKFWSQQRRNEK